MEFISVFDMLKIGIGPSSSHTLGPWKAANKFINELIVSQLIEKTTSVSIELYGSLSLTGKGHATDIATVIGLTGEKPEVIAPTTIPQILEKINKTHLLVLNNQHSVDFSFEKNIIFQSTFLPFHPNGMTLTASGKDFTFSKTYFSVGGGFVVEEGVSIDKNSSPIFVSFPIQNAKELLTYCNSGKAISEIVLANELALQTPEEVDSQLLAIWNVMLESMYIGCHTEGILPGGLNVKRRANDLYKNLNGPTTECANWLNSLRQTEVKFRGILKWVSCFALAVNEVNASLGRVVTAPTNGSAGVIPSVLMYYLMIENHEAGFEEIKRFLLVAGEIGSIFKKGATISAAMGGCQAEIGVSSAMAAGALCELQGGTPEQVMVAAEIAMEHHLGLTCDPIAGLVQIPCIERNAMGAIKAINAAELALNTNPADAKVSLDNVIATLWKTALDMNQKYKETSQGGLAVTVNNSDC